MMEAKASLVRLLLPDEPVDIPPAAAAPEEAVMAG